MKNSKLLFLLLFIFTVSSISAKSPNLKFSDGKFRIIQFTDLHWVQGADWMENNKKTLNLITSLIQSEKPDLIVFTGDVVVSGNAAEGWKMIFDALENLKVPYVIQFGNHDTESDLLPKDVLKQAREYSYCVNTKYNEKLSGAGNCVLTVKDSAGKKNKWALYMIDSQAYSPIKKVGGYAWIDGGQIRWYCDESDRLTRKNNNIPLPSLSFFHIPLPEYEIIRNLDTTLGNKTEGVCSAQVNSGLFTAFLEKGDMLGSFVGHDHNDDFIGKHFGIALAYGRKTGYNSAYEEILERGARIIDLSENQRAFTTYIATLNGRELMYEYKE